MADEIETKLCTNCKRQINAANYVMHEMHCRRHISLCEHCNEPIPKAEMETHFEETHAKINCTKCNQAVEKNLLEQHEENECPKRPAKCSYCELEIARNELESHQDYCGTRTEACIKCGQFIMIKDLNRHEDSNCTFPTPKPANDSHTNNRSLTNGNGPYRNIGASGVDMSDDMLFGLGGEDVVDPFTFDEIHRMLNKPEMSGAAGSEGSRSRVDPESRVKTRVLSNVPPANNRTKKNTEKNKSNKKSDLNRLRERASEENDHLLAMQLAGDLNNGSDLGRYMQNLDKPRSPMTRGSSGAESPMFLHGNPANLHSSLGDISLLPCEFCGQPVPVDELVMHQTHCVDDPLSSMLPQTASSTSSYLGLGDELEDNRYRGIAPESRQPPPIINNLVPEASTHQWNDPIAADGELDEIGLPCEFCDELFPLDFLVQHQAVCERNNSMTPRLSSPVVQRSAKRRTSEENMPTPRTRKHQQAPDISTILGRDGQDTHRTSVSASGRTFHKDVTPTQRINSTLSKYGIAAENPYQQRVERRTLRNSQSKSYDSDEEQASPRPRTGGKSRRGVNAKSTLDNLLREEAPAYDLLGHVTSTSTTYRKNSKDNLNAYRQDKRSSNAAGVKSPSTRVTNSFGAKNLEVGEVPTNRKTTRGNISARDVQNELDTLVTRGSQAAMSTNPARRRPPANRVARTDVGVSPTTSNTRQRERGNNIFSGHTRGETTPTRPSNRNISSRRQDFSY